MNALYGVSVPDWYQGYINALRSRDFMKVLRESYGRNPALLLSIPDNKWNYSYSPGKWTVKEVLLHLTDCERIFAYRALRFARNDKTELSGFDEDEYAPNSNAAKRSDVSIIEEYKAVRAATLTLFEYCDKEMLSRTGYANGHEFSVQMVGAIIAGHELHHFQILKDRYGIDTNQF
ncbi:MAG: DinB family protein [Bacteroidota bacterium]|nr:DinB family protein [Bacteroidota bacterium]